MFFNLFLLGGCQSKSIDCPPQAVNLSRNVDPADFHLLNQAPRGNRQRAGAALALWQLQCPRVSETKIPRSQFNNYSCVVPGSDEKRIIIGAHYDKAKSGSGVADNWSGILITRNLLEYFLQHPPRYTLEFVAFGMEEQEMKGSQAFVSAYQEELDSSRSIIAMINVDTLGLRSLLIDDRSSRHLRCLAANTATALAVDYDFSGFADITGDWQPFKAKGIPVLNLHSVDRGTIRRIHSRRDRPGNVELSYLQQVYELVLNIITNFDSAED